MAEPGAPSSDSRESTRYFLLRRLHSLCGIVPVGVFVFFHLTVNSTILAGPQAFQTSVDQIHLLSRMGLLIPVEILFIFLPLFFHAILGVVIWREGTSNVAVYRYGGNIRYTLQRISGLVAFAFVLFHVWQMHWLGKPFGGGFFDPHDAAASAAGAFQARALWSGVYFIGVAATIYHLANGIWTALITWGITIGPRSQRMAGYACTAFGIVLGLIGMGALYGFATFDAVEHVTIDVIADAARS